jgi:hypothetical protein
VRPRRRGSGRRRRLRDPTTAAHVRVGVRVCGGGGSAPPPLQWESAAGGSAQFHFKLKGICQIYTRYRMAFHMTGINIPGKLQVYDKLKWYISGIYLSYVIRCHMTGIYRDQVYFRYILSFMSSDVGYIMIPGIYHYYKLSRVSRC